MKIQSLMLIAGLLPAMLAAQSPDTLGQQGRTLVSASLGLTGLHSATVDAAHVSAHGRGQVGSLSIAHFVHPSFAVEISGAVLDANNYSVGLHAHHEEVLPVLFGVNWAPTSLAVNDELRPYVSFAIGSYIHDTADASAFSGASATTEMLFGQRIGAGANWFLSRHFALQLEGDFHAVPALQSVDGIRRNVSGFTLSAGLGLAWGDRSRPTR